MAPAQQDGQQSWRAAVDSCDATVHQAKRAKTIDRSSYPAARHESVQLTEKMVLPKIPK
jgi:hypothetical protein